MDSKTAGKGGGTEKGFGGECVSSKTEVRIPGRALGSPQKEVQEFRFSRVSQIPCSEVLDRASFL